MTIPAGTTLIKTIPFKRETVCEILRRMSGARSPFTGYLSLTSGDRNRLLFFFQSRPYAAGLITGNSLAPLSITDFCAQTALLAEGSSFLSLHGIDPVLLKSLLVVLQNEPSAGGAAGLIDLEGYLQQIRQDGNDALVMLNRAGMANLFFFKDGEKSAAYWSDREISPESGAGTAAQLRAYALHPSEKPVDAFIYRNLATTESLDAAAMSLESLIRLFSAGIAEHPAETPPGTVPAATPLTLRISEGPQAGTVISADIPCVLGRKEADVLISDQMVSKRHAAIQIINGTLMLLDLHSTNGTTLNGQPVSRQELKEGDRIGIGGTVLIVESVTLA